MKVRKIPMRSCVVTRERLPKADLIRVVRYTDGSVYVDTTGRMNGRGAYLKRDMSVVLKAYKSKVLNKILDVDVPDSVFDELRGLCSCEEK